MQIVKKLPAHVNPSLLNLRHLQLHCMFSVCWIQHQRVAVCRPGAGVTVLMRRCVWDDSIWAGLMGLICSNWKWSRS